MFEVVRGQWARTGSRPPVPKTPPGWSWTQPTTMRASGGFYHHFSSTGHLPGPLIHAGSLGQARNRANSLYSVDWSEVDTERMLADGKHWKPTSLANHFVLQLTCPVLNPDAPLSDAEANDVALVMQRTNGRGVLRYDNAYEGAGQSVVGPVDCFRLVGVGDGNTATFAPKPLSDAPEVSRLHKEYFAAQRTWERWVEQQHREDDPWAS